MPKLTKEQIEQKHAAQDVNVFLRLADLRIDNGAHTPFNSKNGHLVIAWLRSLADRWGDGEDISEVK